MQLIPDLPLEGHRKGAVKFYQTALGAKVGVLADRFDMHWVGLTDLPAKIRAAKSTKPATKAIK